MCWDPLSKTSVFLYEFVSCVMVTVVAVSV